MNETARYNATVDGGTIYSMPRVVAMLLCTAGMALQWAFLHAMTFPQTVLGSGLDGGARASWIVNMVVTVTVFLALIPASRKLGLVSENKPLMGVMAGCIGSGTAAMLGAYFVSHSAMLANIASALIAAGTATLIIMWGELYRFLNPKGEQVAVTLAGIVVSVVTYQLLTICPMALRVPLFALLPFGSVLCLERSRNMLHELSPTWAPRSHETPQAKSPALFYVYIAVLSIPYNYLQMTGGLTVVSDPQEWSGVLAVTVFIMVAVALAEVFAEKRGVLLVPTVALFLLSAAMLAHVIAGQDAPALASYLLYSGYYLFLAMVYLALGPIAATTGANPTRLFCSAMVANVAGLLAGSLLGGLAPLLGESVTTAVVLVTVYAILFVGFRILNGRSYSIFRVNRFDIEEYSFDFIATLPAQPPEPVAETAAVAENDLASFIERRCSLIAQSSALSARERAVLCELARGKTIATIAHDQTVSENTIKAHTKAVYRKLDVHTREELLSYVESFEG